MRTSQSRRCTLLDVMALIAATAIGFYLVRTYSLNVLDSDLTHYPFIPRILLTIWATILAVLPVPILWSIALFGLRLRRPRPALRRLVREPGFVATGAVTLVVAVRLAGFLVLIARTFGRTTLGALYDVWAMSFFRGPIDVATLYNSVYFASSAIGTSMAVAAAWLLLAVSGRWRSEPGWLDRLGRILGTFWIAIIPFSCWWDYHVLY
jgi:hypothetical protein